MSPRIVIVAMEAALLAIAVALLPAPFVRAGLVTYAIESAPVLEPERTGLGCWAWFLPIAEPAYAWPAAFAAVAVPLALLVSWQRARAFPVAQALVAAGVGWLTIGTWIFARATDLDPRERAWPATACLAASCAVVALALAAAIATVARAARRSYL